jgi:adenylyl- and sulfurtransferase ThiI
MLQSSGNNAINRAFLSRQVNKKAGKAVSLSVENEPVEVAELDEMHTYVGQKKTTGGFGLPLTASANVLSPLSVAIVPRRRD